jgi:uncharacterized protein YcbK (DUF882 family)/LysM repeat protein
MARIRCNEAARRSLWAAHRPRLPAPLSLSPWLVAVLGLLCAVAVPSAAPAQQIQDNSYVVGRGETLSEIAERMHITTRVLAEFNHIEAPYALRNGRRLRVPPEVTDEVYRQLGGNVRTRNASRTTSNSAASTGASRSSATSSGRLASNERIRGVVRTGANHEGSRYGRPAARGYVRLVRESTGAMMDIHMRRITPGVLSRMRAFLRFADGRSHAIHPRLLRQLAQVSDHFGGRRIHVISGFRPFRRGQWTPHSNHNIGRAVDFRVEGISNRVLRDYCRTIPKTGCGYYPRSVFVHMDVRDESATWVDWSRPGQRPQYGREDRPPEADGTTRTAPANARPSEDEGVDDVAQDSPRVREATTVEEHDDDERARRESGDTPGTSNGAGSSSAGTSATGSSATTR